MDVVEVTDVGPCLKLRLRPDLALGLDLSLDLSLAFGLDLSLAFGLGLSLDSPGLRLRFTGSANNTKPKEWGVSSRSRRNDTNNATSPDVCCPARCPRMHFRTPSNVIKQPVRGHK